MNSNDTILVCKNLIFNSKNDEDAFFDWIKKNNCIDSSSGDDDELYLYIACDDLHDRDLKDLLALFHRYNIDMKQLVRFLNDKNKAWFADSKKYWYKSVFGS